MKHLYTVTIFTLFFVSSHLTAFAQNAVDFPDAKLAAAVRSSLGLNPIDPITDTALAGLTHLFPHNKGITNLKGLEEATGLTSLSLNTNEISDITPLEGLTNLDTLSLRENPISSFTPIGTLTNLIALNLIQTGFSDSDIPVLTGLTALQGLFLDGIRGESTNTISDTASLVTALSGMNVLASLSLNYNQISDLTPFSSLQTLKKLHLTGNRITDIHPLRSLTSLTRLDLDINRITDIRPLSSLTALTWLGLNINEIRDISPLGTLTSLTTLYVCLNYYTDISPIKNLVNLNRLIVDNVFQEWVEENFPNYMDFGLLLYCTPRPIPPPEPEMEESEPEPAPEPEPEVKPRRIIITHCGFGWAPQPQYQHARVTSKVMIYALEFEYNPERNAGYTCKVIELRTGDDSIQSLAGWNLYLGTLYNPSSIPLKIPEAHSQITDNILRLTPEMLGLETFRCSTAYYSSQPLPSVHYVLKTDKNILVDRVYSCFLWGQIATTEVNGINVKSPRRISSQALRAMDTPRIERYIMDPHQCFCNIY